MMQASRFSIHFLGFYAVIWDNSKNDFSGPKCLNKVPLENVSLLMSSNLSANVSRLVQT